VKIAERRGLASSPERVWALLADPERYHAWMPDVAWVRALGPERGLGMRLAVRTRVLGISAVTDHMRVTAWDEPFRMAIEHEGLVRGPAEWRLEPTVEGTLFTWTEHLRMPPPLLGEVALHIYRPVLRRAFRASMANLARMVERPE
jgi:carbon monoxide dehydrogenase subunit G